MSLLCAWLLIAFDAFPQSCVLSLSLIHSDRALAIPVRVCLSLCGCLCQCVCVSVSAMQSSQWWLFFTLEGIIWGNLTALGSPVVKLESSTSLCHPQRRWTDQYWDFSSSQNKTLVPSHRENSVCLTHTENTENFRQSCLCHLFRQIASGCEVFHLLHSFSKLAPSILKSELEKKRKKKTFGYIWMLPLNHTVTG